MTDNIFEFFGEVLGNLPVSLFFFILLLVVFLALIMSKNMVTNAWNRMSFGYKLVTILSFIIVVSIIMTL